MRWTVLVTASLICLVLVVYARSSSPRPIPPLSIPAARTHSSPTPTKSPVQPDEPTPHFALPADDVCVGEVPDKTQELATVLQYLHANTIKAFESSPKFGGNRGGFGGGQFGRPPVAVIPPPPPREHPLVPDPKEHRERRKLYEGITSSKNYSPRWTWLYELQGITGRGFVYKSDDRHMVGMPVQPNVDQFLDDVVSSDPATDLTPQERVWEVTEVQLIGVFLHSPPVAFDKHLMINETDESPKTRDLNEFEAESLKDLQAGAQRVIAWNEAEKHLQVLGAIRSKKSCQKCHNADPGQLLGAFSYRIKETPTR